MRILMILTLINILSANEILIQKALESNLSPIPINKNLFENKSQIELGKKLFFEPRISYSNLTSCNSCHNLALGGSNAIPQTKPFNVNVPSVFNANFDANFARKHLATHITGNLKASQNDAKIIESKITNFSQYVIDFKKSYGNNVKIDFDLILQAISSFQNTLITQSRYDDFLRGTIKALSKKEQEGLEIFINKDCINCHNGVNLGGTILDFKTISEYKFANNIKQNESIKVPTLRNITQTSPYLTNGKATSLKEVIALMIKHNDSINDSEIEKIEAFFESLSGKKPEIIYPQLPAK